jgi:alkyl hydroperoxide reductase subunit AhpF
MLLDADIKAQLAQYLQLMEGDILLKVSAGTDDVSRDMLLLIDELATMSSTIKVEKKELERTPSFSVNRIGEDTGVTFAGIPLGHEFTSLVLALLQVSGRAPKVDQKVIDQIKAIKGEYHFESYISLTCHNCPDVVQALNIMSVLNPGVSHTMIDGAAFKAEVESKNIMAVPTVFLNGESFGSGRMTIEEILAKMGTGPDAAELSDKDPYDVLVVGGGPAGASAAIYAARKGIRTGIVAERFGGQVMDTMGIENFIGTKYTEGPKLAASLEEHVKEYKITENVSLSIFTFFDYLPLSSVLSILGFAVVAIYYITVADTATFVLGMLSEGGTLNPSNKIKMTWGVIQSALAAVLLLAGGLNVLQTASIAAALPFAIIMIFMCFSLVKGLKSEIEIQRGNKRSAYHS